MGDFSESTTGVILGEGVATAFEVLTKTLYSSSSQM
jgi:hypothetical protein